MRLFISYSRIDKNESLELSKILRAGGHEVWIDDQLRVGREWRQELRAEIIKADAIVLALTQNWIDSPYCNWEFIVAVENEKKVIPVLLKKTPNGNNPEIPARINKYQRADFSSGFEDNNKIQKFLDDLSILGETVKKESSDLSRKQELERQINHDIYQSIKAGDISDSKVVATPSLVPNKTRESEPDNRPLASDQRAHHAVDHGCKSVSIAQ